MAQAEVASVQPTGLSFRSGANLELGKVKPTEGVSQDVSRSNKYPQEGNPQDVGEMLQKQLARK